MALVGRMPTAGGQLVMTTKKRFNPSKKSAGAPTAPKPDEYTLRPHEIVLSPTVQSAVAMEAWSKFAGEVDLKELVGGLRDRVKTVLEGDMQPVEIMLYGQAVALQTVFTSLTRRAASQEYLSQFQAYLTLALKAQAQCRATLEALAEIKNPSPVAFVKQANIAQQQQVNNAPMTHSGTVSAGAHAGETSGLQNGLLEAPNEQWLDTGAASAAGGADPHLEAVGAVNRTALP